METPEYQRTLDLRGFICPVNFVKAKKEIDGMDDGNVLEIIIDAGEPVSKVPLQMKEAGNRVLKLAKRDDGAFALYVRKGE